MGQIIIVACLLHHMATVFEFKITFLVGTVFGLCIIQIHSVLYGMAYDAQRLHDLSLTINVGASC